MARKHDIIHPPRFYCVTTLPSKPNTTANIVKCLHFSRNVMVSVGVSILDHSVKACKSKNAVNVKRVNEIGKQRKHYCAKKPCTVNLGRL